VQLATQVTVTVAQAL
jgi:hypothetical protein